MISQHYFERVAYSMRPPHGLMTWHNATPTHQGIITQHPLLFDPASRACDDHKNPFLQLHHQQPSAIILASYCYDPA
jgi:hypothetical protein